MLYVGLDLSRKRLDWHALAADGERVGEGACPPDRDGLVHLVHGFDRERGQPVLAAIESMTGARFVHDQLELAGWDVRIADAQRAKGIAPLACKTDRIDAWVLAELAPARPGAGSGSPIRSCAPSGSGRVGGCTLSITTRA
jgi:transposase